MSIASLMNLPEESSQRRALSNTVYWIVLGIILLYLVVYVTFGHWPVVKLNRFDTLVPILLFFAAIAGIVLNRFDYWSVSRWIFLAFWLLLVTILPPLLIGVTTGSYVVHPVLCIISSLMVQLFFSFYRNRVAYITFLTISFLSTLFSFDFLVLFDDAHQYVNLPLKRAQITTIFVMCWVFINLTLMYVYRINWKTYKALQQKNEEIARLNADLEKRVDERTQQLKERNERLRAYAFMNAHVVRAPLSRILGLVNLLNNPQHDPKEETRIKNYLDESARQLDEVIRGASSQLEKNTDEDS